MIIYSPKSPLEAAILESGRFELAIDTAGREVVCVGHRGLPKVVLQMKSDGVQDLVDAVASNGGSAFVVTEEGDPWCIDEAEPDGSPVPIAAEEYLVMGLRPMMSDGRQLRVAASRDIVRLALLPWTLPAKTLNFGSGPHYVVPSTRGVVGEWQLLTDGRSGVVIGVPEIWVGILERQYGRGRPLIFRCDVPVPWVGDNGVSNTKPSTIGVYRAADEYGGPETWVAKLPVIMTEGDVINPVTVPIDVETEQIPDGPWELEWQNSSDFSMESLT